MIYLLDTNAVSDLIVDVQIVSWYFDIALHEGSTVGLCQPVLYEVRRGFFWKQSLTKDKIFNEKVLPRLTTITLTDTDWLQAARFWAIAVSKGKQLADVDLLLAALAFRLDATLVTADDDFVALPVRCVNWRMR